MTNLIDQLRSVVGRDSILTAASDLLTNECDGLATVDWGDGTDVETLIGTATAGPNGTFTLTDSPANKCGALKTSSLRQAARRRRSARKSLVSIE